MLRYDHGMSQYYYGISGKGHGLLCDKRIIVKNTTTGEWRAFDDILEADKYDDTLHESEVVFWENGEWKQVSFLLGGAGAKVVTGFSPVQPT